MQGQVGAPVGEGVALLLGRHVQGLPHAEAGLLVPLLPLGIDAGRLPEPLLLGVGAGVVAAREEERLRRGDLLEGLRGGLAPFDPGRIAGRSDDDEVVVHDQAAVHAEAASAMNFFSASGEWTSSTSASPFCPIAMAWPEPTAMVLTK